MIPYPYNMVDMGGIDLAEANGTVVDGLYAKIVEAVNTCGDVVLYNWKFAGIEISPQHTSILMGDPIIISGAVQVTAQDEVTVPGINPGSLVLVPLEVSENGRYDPSDYDADGFSEVGVAIPGPSLTTLTVSENGTFLPPVGYAGFNEVTVAVSGGGASAGVQSYLEQIAPKYSGGYEYKNYIYGTTKIEDWNLVLLADASQGANSVQLTESIENFSGIILQGIYNKQRTSEFNTTLLYLSPQLYIAYWAGMKDRNQSYTCNVTFTSNTGATLSGNKQVIIYGIP